MAGGSGGVGERGFRGGLESHGLLRVAVERLLGVRFQYAVPQLGHAGHGAESGGDVQQPSDRGAQSVRQRDGGSARALCAHPTHGRELSEPGGGPGVGFGCGGSDDYEPGAGQTGNPKQHDTGNPGGSGGRGWQYGWLVLRRFGDGDESGSERVVAGRFGLVGERQFRGGLESDGLLRVAVERLLGVCVEHAIPRNGHAGTLQNRAGTFSSHQTSAPNPSSSIAVGAPGRYVRVQLTGANYLSLAEVQVLGTAAADSNLALLKTATESSTIPGTPSAAAAVDGNTDGQFFDGSVTATNPDTNAWWQVDLGASATVDSVVVWNRTDCCGSRLGDYWGSCPIRRSGSRTRRPRYRTGRGRSAAIRPRRRIRPPAWRWDRQDATFGCNSRARTI